MKRLAKITVVVIIMAFLSVIASLQTIVSSLPFKQQLIKTLTEKMPGEWRLDQLILDFTTGIEIKTLQWHQQGAPRLQLEHMALDILWRDLLQGKLTIREIRLSHGHLIASSDETPQPSEPEPVLQPFKLPPSALLLSTLPIQLDLQSLILEDIHLDFPLTPSRHLSLETIALRAALRMNKQGVELQGKLTVDALTVADEQGTLSVPVELNFHVSGDINQQGVLSHQAALRLGNLIHIPLAVHIKTQHQPSDIHLTVAADPVALAPILTLLQPWLPHEWIPCSITGLIEPRLEMTGQWHTDGLHGRAWAELLLRDLVADLPAQGIGLKQTQLRFTVPEMIFHANTLEPFTTELSLTTPGITWNQQRMEDLSMLLVADYRPDGTMRGHGRIKSGQITPERPQLNVTPFPFEAMALVRGHLPTQTLMLDRMILKAGKELRMRGHGSLIRDPGPAEAWAIRGQLRTELDTMGLTPWLPHYLPPGMTLQIKPGTSQVMLQGLATLNAKGMTQHLTTRGTALLTPMLLRQETTGAQIDIQGGQFSWQAEQRLPDAPVDGKLQGTLHLGAMTLENTLSSSSGRFNLDMEGAFIPETQTWTGNIQLKTMQEQLTMPPHFTAARVQTLLNATVKGNPTPEQTRPAFVIEEHLSGQAMALNMTDGHSSLHLPELNFTLQGQNDLGQGVHRIKQLRLHAGTWLDARFSGQYQESSDRYELTAHLLPLELRQLEEKLLVNEQPWLAQTQTRGRVDLKLESSGVVAALLAQQEAVPAVQAAIQLTGKDLSVPLGINRIHGGQGTLLLKIQPETRQFNLTTKMQAGHLLFDKGRHPDQLRDIHLEMDLTGLGLDRWTVNRGQVGMPGVVAAVQGKMAGTTSLLRQQGSGVEQLNALFLDLSGQIKMDLAREKQFLSAFGIKGQGEHDLDLTAFKPAMGPVEIRLTGIPRGLSWQQSGFSMTGLEGKWTGLKTFGFIKPSTPPKVGMRRMFSLERITTPAAWKSTDKRVGIAGMEIAGIRAEEIAMTVSFLEDTIRGQDLEMRLLGGTIGGNVLLEGVKPSRFDAVLEGVALDLNQLMPGAKRITGESTVNFVSRHSIRFDRDTGRLNWGRTEINVLFTHIGKEAVDRLLLFLDPKESNPAIVNARSKVSYANPATLDLQLTKGTIKLKIDFREGLVSTLTIDRIPLGILGRFEQMQHHLFPLEYLARFLENLGISYWPQP
ncbi:MAG: hypothetical protein H7839_13815 [Magnetococcus sp. YQC-5]